MVARSPAKQKRMNFPPLNPTLLRETVIKVDKCMARLQELQYTVAGGSKMVCGIRFKKNTNLSKSPSGKLPIQTEEWRRMSLPAMLVGETVGEILQASKFAREIVAATQPSKNRIPLSDDPITPVSVRRKPRLNNNTEDSELRSKRRREKQVKLRKDSVSPVLQRARSRISFKASSPLHLQEKENNRYLANRVSPRNRPWTKKTVLFPNPLFHSSPTSNNPRFCKTKSPIIAKSRPKTPHKFLIKTRSPAPKSPPFKTSSLSSNAARVKRSFSPPIKVSSTSSTAARLRRSCSPPPKVSSSGTAARLKRSFSPSRLANKLMSPLKTRKSFVQKSDGLVSGMKQRPGFTPIRFPARRI